MNDLHPNLVTGAVGELLVQLRLLQFDVQAAPPLRDSGNDLIALRGRAVRSIQVKSSLRNPAKWVRPAEEREYDLVALVALDGEDRRLDLDKSVIYLVPKRDLPDSGWPGLGAYELSESLVDSLFDGACEGP